MSSETSNLQGQIMSFATERAISKIIKMNEIAGRYEGADKIETLQPNWSENFNAAIRGLREEISELEVEVKIEGIQKEFADVLHYIIHIWYLIDLHRRAEAKFFDPKNEKETELYLDASIEEWENKIKSTYPCQAAVLDFVARQNMDSKFTSNYFTVCSWKNYWQNKKEIFCTVRELDGIYAIVATHAGAYKTIDSEGKEIVHEVHAGKFLKNPKLVMAEDYFDESNNSD